MINLHERLSECSYGCDITRDTELLFEKSVFARYRLPSLVQENDLGFNVAFDRLST